MPLPWSRLAKYAPYPVFQASEGIWSAFFNNLTTCLLDGGIFGVRSREKAVACGEKLFYTGITDRN